MRGFMRGSRSTREWRSLDQARVPVVVQQGEAVNFIFVAQKSGAATTVKKKAVEVGESYNGATQILKGLSVGEIIITKGYQNVNDGDAIQH